MIEKCHTVEMSAPIKLVFKDFNQIINELKTWNMSNELTLKTKLKNRTKCKRRISQNKMCTSIP